MERTIGEKIVDLKRENEIGFIVFYNDGTKESIPYKEIGEMEDTGVFIGSIKLGRIFLDTAKENNRFWNFNQMNMDIKLGLVYKKEDVFPDYRLKPNAKPVDEIVSYYINNIRLAYNGVKGKTVSHKKIGYGNSGYLNYESTIKNLKEEGISFDGPESFNEFANRITNGEIFDVNYYFDFVEKKEENKKLTKKLF